MGRLRIRGTAATLFAMSLASLGATQVSGQMSSKPPISSSAAAGRQTFSSICASCHGLDGKGAERGPDITTRPEITRLTDEETLKILRAGIPEQGMPAFATLGEAKLKALLAYIRVLQGQAARAPLSGDVNKGNELFSGKAGCSECHMVRGSGGFLGPELSDYGANHSAAEIRAAIVNPKEKTSGRHGSAEVITKDGKSYSGLVRNEDNFSLQLQSSDGAFHFFSKADLAAINVRTEPLMPADYGTKLSAAELDALSAYLIQAARSKPKP